jgi:hypothetical protein
LNWVKFLCNSTGLPSVVQFVVFSISALNALSRHRHPSNRSQSDGTDQLLCTQQALIVGTCAGRAEKGGAISALCIASDSDSGHQAKRILSTISAAASAASFVLIPSRQALVLGSQGNEEEEQEEELHRFGGHFQATLFGLFGLGMFYGCCC